MRRAVRLPSAYTLFTKLLTLRERAGLFGARPSEQKPVKLHVETMEERLVPATNPLPAPVIFVGSGIGDSAALKAYNADAGTLRFSTSVLGSSTAGVNVAAGDFTGDGNRQRERGGDRGALRDRLGGALYRYAGG
jgi:hypothetical protein